LDGETAQYWGFCAKKAAGTLDGWAIGRHATGEQGRASEAREPWMRPGIGGSRVGAERMAVSRSLPLGAVGGMDVAVRHVGPWVSPASAFHDVFRIAANDWGFAVGTFVDASADHDKRVARLRETIRAAATRSFRPSFILGELHDRLSAEGSGVTIDQIGSIIFGRLQLDACGAWVTLANAGELRPFATRQAGWIDVRGNAASSPASTQVIAPSDDRVGLGPGDALVVISEEFLRLRDEHNDRFGDEALPDLLLNLIPRTAHEIAERTMAGALDFGGGAAPDDGVVMVIRVPAIARGQALERVSRATGIPAHELELPGYPIGDVQPELWKAPPSPPREARIKLRPEPLSVPALRRLLRRLLQSWRIAPEGDLELLATEVATNVFAGANSPVTAIVRYDGEVVRVEIGDGASAQPRRTLPGYDELSGPGLLLVDALSTEWGVVRTREGRRVWFEVSVGAYAGL
jgi:hypothetical protein